MRRITLGGGLDDFTSVAPDQQVKLFFARPRHGLDELPAPVDRGGDVMSWYQAYLAIPEERRPWMCSYTVRRHHPERREIEIDFELHGDGRAEQVGPASRWAATARPGAEVGMVGPAASHLREPRPHDWMLLAGDETALPAIGALLEALPPRKQARVFVEVADAAEEQQLAGDGAVRVRWLHRDGRAPGAATALVDAIRAAEMPAGSMFGWIAGEASLVRAVRRHPVADRGVDKRQIAFTGYWRRHLSQDAEPTAEDAAERAELLSELAERGGAPR